MIQRRWQWDLFFVVVVVSVLSFLAFDRSPGPPRHVLASSSLLVAALVWYAVVGRPTIFGATGDSAAVRRWVFIGGLAALFLPAVWLDHTSSFALFGFGPMVFLTLPIRPAIVVIAALDLLPIGIAQLRDGTLGKVHGLLPVTMLGLAFAILIGTYINRLAEQNQERAAMIAELSASRAEVARLSHEAGVATERARLAAEIHDTLAQGFTSIITLVQAAESELDRDRASAVRRLDLTVRTARDNLAEARTLVAALSPAALSGGGRQPSGLSGAIQRQADRFTEEAGVPVNLAIDDGADAVPTAVQVVVVRTLQEALTNVRRHAEASSVAIGLALTQTAVTLTVTDDGQGFESTMDSSGFGLPGMRARASQIGGVLTIDTAKDHGTTVRLEAPR